jgi:hypothetical protein
VDWTGGQITDDDSAEDIKKVDLSQVGTGSLFQVLSCSRGLKFYYAVPSDESAEEIQTMKWTSARWGLHSAISNSSACSYWHALATSTGHQSRALCQLLLMPCCCCCRVLLLLPCAAAAVMLQVHYLSGPIRVVDKDGAPAQPGGVLLLLHLSAASRRAYLITCHVDMQIVILSSKHGHLVQSCGAGQQMADRSRN